jgi:protein-tyrosine phosphatase
VRPGGAEPRLAVLFVCLGNICRSPSAEAVMAALVAERGLEDRIAVDSAGTASYHVGDRPDGQALAALARRGLATDHRGRQFRAADFDRFDVIAVMDAANEASVVRLARGSADRAKVVRLRAYDPQAADGSAEVDDPYGHRDRVFDEMMVILERSCRGLLTALEARIER